MLIGPWKVASHFSTDATGLAQAVPTSAREYDSGAAVDLRMAPVANRVGAEGEGLPTSFQDRLSRALRHYDVLSLDRTPELERAVFRLFLAQQRIDHQVPVVLGLLEGPGAALFEVTGRGRLAVMVGIVPPWRLSPKTRRFSISGGRRCAEKPNAPNRFPGIGRQVF